MKVSDLVKTLNLQVFTNTDLQTEITGGYASDLLSDVIANADEGNCWITLQNHLNVVAIGSLKDVACIILIKNLKPSDEMIEKANEEGLVLLGSSEHSFELAGEIYKLLK